MKPPHIIIDSSVALKWFLPKEEFLKQALDIKQLFESRTISISIPILFFYEVNNILKNNVANERINHLDAPKMLQALMDLDFTIYSTSELFIETFKTAVEFNITSYDASYVALAKNLQIPFYTADTKLVKQVNSSLVLSIQGW